jgi:hypothetical protein
MCSCGWTSAFKARAGAAIEAWGSHQGRRDTDAIGSLRRDQANAT